MRHTRHHGTWYLVHLICTYYVYVPAGYTQAQSKLQRLHLQYKAPQNTYPYYYVALCFFLDSCTLFSGARGSFLALSAAGTQGGRLYTTAQAWVPGGLRGACSGRSKSRIMVLLSAKPEPSKTVENPYGMSAVLLHCCKSSLCGSQYTRAVAHQVCVHHYRRLWTVHMRVCVLVCWNPTCQLFSFLALLAAAAAVPCVSPRPSSPHDLVAATVQHKSHSVWTTAYYACFNKRMRVCCVLMCS